MTELAPVQQRLMEFIRQYFSPGTNHYNVSKLVGDASARQYYRYLKDTENSLILAVYPEPFDPIHFPYKQIYDLMRSLELPVPEIFALDGALGIVLQEDLGNESLQKKLMKAAEQERKHLLRTAIDYIVTLQTRGPECFSPEYEGFRMAFDEDKLNWELRFFKKNYLESYRRWKGLDSARLDEEFQKLAAELAARPRLICHRDYHVRNLMLKNDILYLIDFQDARWGPAAYDLVSLLKDSIELDPAEIEGYVEYYRKQMSVAGFLPEGETFNREFQLVGLQRLLKALGTFGYQITARENFIYEQYISGSLRRALLSLQEIREFPYIQSLIEKELR